MLFSKALVERSRSSASSQASGYFHEQGSLKRDKPHSRKYSARPMQNAHCRLSMQDRVGIIVFSRARRRHMSPPAAPMTQCSSFAVSKSGVHAVSLDK